MDALGRIYNTARDHPTAVEHTWEEVVCRVQARLPYLTARAFVAILPVSTLLVTRGNPHSPPARLRVRRHTQNLVQRCVQDCTAGAELR